MDIKSTEKSKLRILAGKALSNIVKPILFISLILATIWCWVHLSGIIAFSIIFGMSMWIFGESAEGDALGIPAVSLVIAILLFMTVGTKNKYEGPTTKLDVKVMKSEIVIESEKIFVTLDPELRKGLPNSKLEDNIVVIKWLSDKAFYAVKENAEKPITAQLVRTSSYDHQDMVFKNSKPSLYELEMHFFIGGTPLTTMEYEYECKTTLCSEFFKPVKPSPQPASGSPP